MQLRYLNSFHFLIYMIDIALKTVIRTDSFLMAKLGVYLESGIFKRKTKKVEHCYNCFIWQVVPAWLSCLPLKGDLIEAKVVHAQLCSMVERWRYGIFLNLIFFLFLFLMQNYPFLFTVILKNNCISLQVRWGNFRA